MSNTERVMALLRQRPGLTDRQIREATRIEPHQQVNQITSRLARQGRIRRAREAALWALACRALGLGHPLLVLACSARKTRGEASGRR